jgi:hypothetical protein
MAHATGTSTAAAAAGTTSAAAADAAPPEPGKKRRRRTVDAFLRPVYPISAILASATAEERQKARMLCGEILGYWLGHESKADVARRLSMPPIRVWQMGQRALSGMVAALLTPPTGRRGAMPRIDPETKELRRRVAELEAETDLQRRLIKLLRTMPGNEHRELPKEESDAKRAPRKRKPAKAVERALPPSGRGAGQERPPAAG